MFTFNVYPESKKYILTREMQYSGGKPVYLSIP